MTCPDCENSCRPMCLACERKADPYAAGYEAAVRDFWRAACEERAATIRRRLCVADPRKERLWDEGRRWWEESGFYEEQYQEYVRLRAWAKEGT